MSWLRDPDSGELAKPLTEDDLKMLGNKPGRRRHMRWVVLRDKDGEPIGAELQPTPKDQIGLENDPNAA